MFDVNNSSYLMHLYQCYLENPSMLPIEWRNFFHQNKLTDDQNSNPTTIKYSLQAFMLINAFRTNGHMMANLDPLSLNNNIVCPELDYTTYGFTTDDLNQPIFLNNVLKAPQLSLQQILQNFQAIYCQNIGFEFMHIQDLTQKTWLQDRIENRDNFLNNSQIDPLKIYQSLAKAELFEKFLNTKFTGAKRFGIEGGESTIVALEFLLEQLAEKDVATVILGMSHRGRLNVLANVLQQPMYHLFAQFLGVKVSNLPIAGDVKYHLGYSGQRSYGDKNLHLSLVANPSHLEAVYPVVLGKTRAKQKLASNPDQVVAVVLHGDAAFAGQGLVSECLSLSGLKGYSNDGTIHFIINNQIGFTTSPAHSRSSPYSSDIAKVIQAPIFHVNGDNPEDVARATKLALEFKMQFKHDVVVDIICYRRFGHNESDDPFFTQPIMYKKISQHLTTKTLYKNYLLEKNTVKEADINAIDENILQNLNTEFTRAGTCSEAEKILNWLEGEWESIDNQDLNPSTGVALERLKELGKELTKIPENFLPHPRLKNLLQQKLDASEKGYVDWALAESLAFATLLSEKIDVRLSGQDSGRGTFSHRHAVFVDQENESTYIPLNNISSNAQGKFEILDSPLAEASVLGFEYGYSTVSPKTLVLWEAQFGDFANGAQVIIDQFIASSEIKWLRLSGLVMLLPHGMEGQGPEHSSARLERYLQLSAENNWQIVNCTTPANYFHVLRRQIHNNQRKPLIIMTPKSLLRHKLAISPLSSMAPETKFQKVIDDEVVINPKRVILCSGKIYYDLVANRPADLPVAIIRIEQLYQFPTLELKEILSKYLEAEIIWCQEEPINMGAWFFVAHQLEGILLQLKAKYVRPYCLARKASASPATGIVGQHETEQNAIIKQAFSDDLTHKEIVYVRYNSY